MSVIEMNDFQGIFEETVTTEKFTAGIKLLVHRSLGTYVREYCIIASFWLLLLMLTKMRCIFDNRNPRLRCPTFCPYVSSIGITKIFIIKKRATHITHNI